MHALRTIVTSLAAILLSAHTSFGKIQGISAPSTVFEPGSTIPVTFTTESFIDANAQYYVLFGLDELSGNPQPLQTLLGTGADLVATGHSSTGHGSFVINAKIPSSFDAPATATTYTLNAVVLGTYGAANGAALTDFTTTIQIASTD